MTTQLSLHKHISANTYAETRIYLLCLVLLCFDILLGEMEACHHLISVNVVSCSHLGESEERKVKGLVPNICRNAEDG